jgi:AAA+ superfamily predicted ATPase
MGMISEEHAKRLISLGSNLSKEEGGLKPLKIYPIYAGKKLAGYGFNYYIENVSKTEAKDLIKILGTWLTEDYDYYAANSIVSYVRADNYRTKKKAIRLRGRATGRRTEIFFIPEKMPPPRKQPYANILANAFKKLVGKRKRRWLEYTLEDLIGSRNFEVEVRVFEPYSLDLVSAAFNVGNALGKREIDKRQVRYAKTLRTTLLEKYKGIGWDDIGGYEEVKREIQFKVQGPLLNKDVYKIFGLSIPNMCIIGPPGVGKTMVLNALITTTKNCNFIPFQPEYVAPFLGRSEAMIGELFELCDQITKETGQYTLLLWDEMDDIGSRFDVGRERVVNALLRLMGGAESYDFSIIGATNRPNELDPAFFRGGRIDYVIYMDTPNLADREKILELYTKDLPLSSEVDIREIAERTEDFTGANLMSLCRDAKYNAIMRMTGNNIKKLSDIKLESVEITKKDFDEALRAKAGSIKEVNRRWKRSFVEWTKQHEIDIHRMII